MPSSLRISREPWARQSSVGPDVLPGAGRTALTRRERGRVACASHAAPCARISPAGVEPDHAANTFVIAWGKPPARSKRGHG
jgi:hypothetical protein